jgi:hypothetical protein
LLLGENFLYGTRRKICLLERVVRQYLCHFRGSLYNGQTKK